MAGYEWDTDNLARMETLGLKFQQLYGKLESQLQLHKEVMIARLKDKVLSKGQQAALAHDENVLGKLFSGQGGYGKNPSHFGDMKSTR